MKWRNLWCAWYLYISKKQHEFFRKILSPIHQSTKRIWWRTNFRFYESHVEIRNKWKWKVFCHKVEVRTGPWNKSASFVGRAALIQYQIWTLNQGNEWDRNDCSVICILPCWIRNNRNNSDCYPKLSRKTPSIHWKNKKRSRTRNNWYE